MGSYPYLGAGVGLRRDHYEALETSERRVDWFEIVSENFMLFGGRPRAVLERARSRCPVIPHGVALDIGGREDPDPDYVERLAALAAELDAPYVSDHLCFTKLAGTYTHELLPLPFREDVVAVVAERVRSIQERVGRPLLLENPSYYVVMPGSELEEAAFLRRILEEADCGLLLDVNNLYVNSVNLGYDALAFLDALPLERLGYVHLAGHHHEERAIIDSHSTAVPDPVWALYDALLERTGPVSTLIEWDLAIPDLDTLLDEADKARARLEAL